MSVWMALKAPARSLSLPSVIRFTDNSNTRL
jgi:hypothetical protein